MKLQKNMLAALLAGLLALGAVACDQQAGEDPLIDDGGAGTDTDAGTDMETTPTPTE